jgi:hypothetical protein
MKKIEKNINVVKGKNLYGWVKNWKKIQENYWNSNYKIRRLQQIEDFIKLNNYKKVYHVEEVRLDLEIPTVDTVEKADLILVTHQGYSRYPLDGIIEQCNRWLDFGDLYLCLNRQYLNINNQPVDILVDDNYQIAITQWLSNKLSNCVVVDISRDYIDDGSYFTWACPDRHYFIKRIV